MQYLTQIHPTHHNEAGLHVERDRQRSWHIMHHKRPIACVWWRDDVWRVAERITHDDGTAYWAVFDTRADTAPPQQGPVPPEKIVQWALEALWLKGIVPTPNANLTLAPEPQ